MCAFVYYCSGICSPARAASEFTTTFTSLYTIPVRGETSVTHTITLKNNLAHIYATNYTLSIGADELTQVHASDEFGPLTTSTNKQDGITTIHLEINHPTIGKDQQKTLVLNYVTSDIAEKIGNTLAINIPRLAKAGEIANYTRIVKVAGVEYLPSHIYPPQSQTQPDGIFTTYTFVGHERDSLSLLFGDSVTYELNLKYELKNKGLSGADSELALPPDTSYQRITLGSLSPPPQSIRLDADGNWLARYSLEAGGTLSVYAQLYATIYPLPILFDPSTSIPTQVNNSKFWDSSSEPLTTLANQLKEPQHIYNYLVDNFKYDYKGLVSGSVRAGALSALTNMQSVLCTEFTDTFVSLARTQGIPSREINGYAYTANAFRRPQNTVADILHAWPEYFDSHKSVWIAVDPTWGNTTGGIDYFHKLDFSHITFVRHGAEDSYPLPAGAYKSSVEDKQIDVVIASNLPDPNPSYKVVRDGGHIQVLNDGNVALINHPVQIEGTSYTLTYLPPYGTYLIPPESSPTWYDKIKLICAKLLSLFWQRRPVSM